MTGGRHIPLRRATLVVAGLCAACVGIGAGLAVSQPVGSRAPNATPGRATPGRAGAVATAQLAGAPGRPRSRGAQEPRRGGRRVRRSLIELTAVDPGYAYGIQVGDTVTFTATVRDPNVARPDGLVTFRADERYDSCPAVRLHRSTTATCYLTFYSPGAFSVTARYDGRDRSIAAVTLHFTVVPATDD